MECDVKFVNSIGGDFNKIGVIMEPKGFGIGSLSEVGFKNFDFKFR